MPGAYVGKEQPQVYTNLLQKLCSLCLRLLLSPQVSSKSPLDLCKELRANLIATVPFYLHHKTGICVFVEIQQTIAGVFKFRQPLAPCRLTIIFPLDQFLSRDIVLA